MANSGESEVSTSELAKILGKTARWINELTREGVLVQTGRGKYPLAESVQRYVEHLKKQYEEVGGIDYAFEKAAHERAKREKAEIELAAMRGQMHRGEDIAAVMNDMVGGFRAKMLGLPSKVAPQLVGKTETPVILAILTQEVHDSLSELSDYDPRTFLAASEDYVEVDDDEDSG
ncbi:hypothetical protein [Tumebacillus permanentifrigoris]|uniref:Phage terminase Nu1 subunit (DNA packaging protein) n=1 Tax=Tumebacillus permanentifrigoris TaxID=378543 RepID=A0A316DDI3_9BACL|nr:hypothetical protein [Tumebacillus permanentifrigoris]PWK16074.1 phage terminase Nu1 subunit (DNA packaging protein) [Tumebacillus permanentifrigoris]